MPADSLNTNQGRQIIILSEKIEHLTTVIKTLVDKADIRDASLVAFQKDYYVEHQKLLSDVAKHDRDLSGLRKDVDEVEDCTDNLKARTMPVDDIAVLKKIVFGNGNIGLVGKVDRIEQWMANQVWFQRLVIGAIVGQVIVIVVLLIRGV